VIILALVFIIKTPLTKLHGPKNITKLIFIDFYKWYWLTY